MDEVYFNLYRWMGQDKNLELYEIPLQGKKSHLRDTVSVYSWAKQ